MLFLVLANYFYQFSIVFYNSLLRHIAPPEKWGRISGIGQTGNLLGQVFGLLITLPLASGAVYLFGAVSLINIATQIWPYPTTTITRTSAEEQLFDLTAVDSFSGSKPSFLYIDGSSFELKTWRDLMINVCKFLYNFSPTQFSVIQNSKEFDWYFNIKKPLRCPIEFISGKYVEGAMSANSIVNFLYKISKGINYDPEMITFSIKVSEQ